VRLCITPRSQALGFTQFQTMFNLKESSPAARYHPSLLTPSLNDNRRQPLTTDTRHRYLCTLDEFTPASSETLWNCPTKHTAHQGPTSHPPPYPAIPPRRQCLYALDEFNSASPFVPTYLPSSDSLPSKLPRSLQFNHHRRPPAPLQCQTLQYMRRTQSLKRQESHHPM